MNIDPFNQPQELSRVDLLDRLHRLMLPTDESTTDSDQIASSTHMRIDEFERYSGMYKESLPLVPFSRCPFTGEEHWHHVDVFGLDGPWWAYNQAIRPHTIMPKHHWAITGAISLIAPVEKSPFLSVVGPAAPFVVPEILQHPEIIGVLASITIGSHEAYYVHYFSKEIRKDIPRFNTWGIDHYEFINDDGEMKWGYVADEDAEGLDFDLAPWFQQGKLMWIAPGDDTLTLQSDIDRCPYLNITGTNRFQYLQEGKVWTEDDI